MEESARYKLKKPGANDYISVDDLNANMDIIDKALGETEDLSKKSARVRTFSLAAANWSAEYPFTQTLPAEGIATGDRLKVIGLHIPSGATAEEVKAYKKAAGCLMSNLNGVGDGSVTFLADRRPVSDFIIVTEGG